MIRALLRLLHPIPVHSHARHLVEREPPARQHTQSSQTTPAFVQPPQSSCRSRELPCSKISRENRAPQNPDRPSSPAATPASVHPPYTLRCTANSQRRKTCK